MSAAAYPTGTELVGEIKRAAHERQIAPTALVRPLTVCPGPWLAQLGRAARPKPLTIARVRALIAGEQIPLEKAGGPVPELPLSHYEAVVLQTLSDAAETGEACPSNALLANALGRSIAWSAGDVVKRLEARGLITVKRFSNSRQVTIVATGRSTAAVADQDKPVEAAPRPTHKAAEILVLAPAPKEATARDRRMMAPSREPCPYCNVRGDLGCKHQAPFEPLRGGAGR
jgi:hypothetical protein